MRHLSILLLLAGCSSPPEKNNFSADELAKRKVAILEKCDSIVGPLRDSEDYLSCMVYIEGEL